MPTLPDPPEEERNATGSPQWHCARRQLLGGIVVNSDGDH
jgi:hypothetical protein